MQEGKVVVWGGLTNSWEKLRCKRQRRKGKIHPNECRVPENSKERFFLKKIFLCEQCKEIEESNRIRKTRELLKKIRDSKGIFHAKMGTIKFRNIRDLTEIEEVKKSWEEYTEEWYKKGLDHPDNHDGMVTHLEPDILECEIKRALENITMNKASRGDGIPTELFRIQKDDAVKVLHSICHQIWKTQRWPQLENFSFHSNPKERQCQRMFKLPHNCTHLIC